MSKEQWIKENLKDGEIYAGILLGIKGEPDVHLIVLPGEADSVNWKQAKEWAKKVGGDLPTRREQRILFANAKEAFKAEWYWSGEQHADYDLCAWYQGFSSGYQDSYDKSSSLRARAVRRLVIQ